MWPRKRAFFRVRFRRPPRRGRLVYHGRCVHCHHPRRLRPRRRRRHRRLLRPRHHRPACRPRRRLRRRRWRPGRRPRATSWHHSPCVIRPALRLRWTSRSSPATTCNRRVLDSTRRPVQTPFRGLKPFLLRRRRCPRRRHRRCLPLTVALGNWNLWSPWSFSTRKRRRRLRNAASFRLRKVTIASKPTSLSPKAVGWDGTLEFRWTSFMQWKSTLRITCRRLRRQRPLRHLASLCQVHRHRRLPPSLRGRRRHRRSTATTPSAHTRIAISASSRM